MITVVDYGMGNLASVVNAIKLYTKDVNTSSKPEEIKLVDKLIVPGVGAFEDAKEEIEKRKLREPILEFIKSGKPFLGICLGMQLLLDKSFEDGEHGGFGLIKGVVVPFDKKKALKVPHIGWNSLTYNLQHRTYNCPLLQGVPEGAYMYFVHSYYAAPEDKSVVCTTTDYGVEFCSMLWKDNIYAMQFHPEKSQKEGLKIIENFVSL